MNSITEMLVTIIMGAVGVAALAVFVSRNSNTAAVIQSAASGYGNILDVAVSPVTGATTTPNLAYPGGMGTGIVYGGFSPSS
jgi:hypothetical protein